MQALKPPPTHGDMGKSLDRSSWVQGPQSEAIGPCLMWRWCVDDAGYGRVTFRPRWASTLTHHVAFCVEHCLTLCDMELLTSVGLLILHVCDTPACINPRHLVLGTKKDNTADMLTKERSKSHLSFDAVRAIFLDTRKGEIVAEDYGVSKGVIHAIWSRQNFGWATKDLPKVVRRLGPARQK